METYSPEMEQQMQWYYQSLSEKDRRRYGAIEAEKLDYGGIIYISKLLGCNYRTIAKGIEEFHNPSLMSSLRIRRRGGGRKQALLSIDGIDEAFLKVIQHRTVGGSPVLKVITQPYIRALSRLPASTRSGDLYQIATFSPQTQKSLKICHV